MRFAGDVGVMRVLTGWLFALVVIVSACTQAPDDTSPEATAREGGLDFADVETVATGLMVPWGIAFLDADTILVTERGGDVRVVADGVVREEPAATIEVRDEGEAGLLGIAVHPGYPDERFAYLYYTTAADNRVSRFEIDDELGLVEEEVILDGIPAASIHDGGRIAFGPDDLLYVTTGDATRLSEAADPDALAGKILRIAADGSIPDGNPFDDSPVYSYGHRNPQGLDWDGEGRLYVAEHGPSSELGLCCHDEVNLVEPGAFYGWPYVAGSAPAESGEPPEEPVVPIAESGSDETWAPAGLAVHEGDGDPSLYVANLRGEQLLRFVLDGPEEVARTEVALEGLGRLRAVSVGPDDCLYLTTSNRDGRGSPTGEDDRVLRVCPS